MAFSCFRACESCKDHTEEHVQEIVAINVKLFSYNSIRSATQHFHPSNKIGGGGFGVVYKLANYGIVCLQGILRNGTPVAIKCLSAESKQGTNEFLTEINMISNIQHPNLVQLVGCCVEGSDRMLIYEYMENNSIASALLGFVISSCSLSAILCCFSFHSVIWYCAQCRGYLAPEYAMQGKLTKKADVYSFGVLLLEIISGRSSSKAAFGVDLLILVEWTWKLKEEGRLLEIVDPELTDYPEAEVMRFIKVALFCTQAAYQQRPSMKQVVEMLSKEVRLNEKILTEPGVYRLHNSGKAGFGSLQTSSSHLKRGNQAVNPFGTSAQFDSFQSATQMLPR
nr:putative serine/threonine-protein kinase [Ipomoea batatas]